MTIEQAVVDNCAVLKTKLRLKTTFVNVKMNKLKNNNLAKKSRNF